MSISEFITYIEARLNSKDAFYAKSLDDQLARNQRRAPAKRWNEVKMERVIDKQWKELLTNVYNQIRPQINKDLPGDEAWLNFLTQDDFLESIDESVFEIEFE